MAEYYIGAFDCGCEWLDESGYCDCGARWKTIKEMDKIIEKILTEEIQKKD